MLVFGACCCLLLRNTLDHWTQEKERRRVGTRKEHRKGGRKQEIQLRRRKDAGKPLFRRNNRFTVVSLASVVPFAVSFRRIDLRPSKRKEETGKPNIRSAADNLINKRCSLWDLFISPRVPLSFIKARMKKCRSTVKSCTQEKITEIKLVK